MVFDVFAAILFVFSSGLFFNDNFRRNPAVVFLAGFIAVISTYYLTRDIANKEVSAITSELQEKPQRPGPRGSIPPFPPPPHRNHETNPPTHDFLVRTDIARIAMRETFVGTKNALDWMISAGSDNHTRDVSDSTVLDTIVAAGLFVLGLLIGLTGRLIFPRRDRD